jgi:hypothetical protein
MTVRRSSESAIAAEALMKNAGQSAGLLGHDLKEFDLEH